MVGPSPARAATAFHENRVPPATVVGSTDALTRADDSEADALVCANRRNALGKKARLEHPHALRLCGADDGGHKQAPDTLAAVSCSDVDHDLADPGVDCTPGGGTHAGESHDRSIGLSNKPAREVPSRVPIPPAGNFVLEGRVTGIHALPIDLPDVGPVFRDHVAHFDLHPVAPKGLRVASDGRRPTKDR